MSYFTVTSFTLSVLLVYVSFFPISNLGYPFRLFYEMVPVVIRNKIYNGNELNHC